MVIGTRPFFLDVATHVGKLINLHGQAIRSQIKRRMTETWGIARRLSGQSSTFSAQRRNYRIHTSQVAGAPSELAGERARRDQARVGEGLGAPILPDTPG